MFTKPLPFRSVRHSSLPVARSKARAQCVIEAAVRAPRPVALCVCPTPAGLQNTLIRHAVAGFAEAFFAQFGLEKENC
jgi:hypothetical protein